ncbi:hypothetical protein NDU88_004921 [Pleurodeles waltl]|uniref:Uncharacterized protein n=1 Tax=Pleurodeles waltl TaxID=8319 RepID=A0AAV7WA00_PLEWA|nr:hypothetical protein NDU88_004921 [Pleurodeles waltl]
MSAACANARAFQGLDGPTVRALHESTDSAGVVSAGAGCCIAGGAEKLYHGERLESEGSEMTESHVREKEVFRRPSSHGDIWLPSCPSQASEEREGMDIASPRAPDRSEEKAHPKRSSEVTNREASPREEAWTGIICDPAFRPWKN